MIGFVDDLIEFASHLTLSCPLVQHRQLLWVEVEQERYVLKARLSFVKSR
jgi:hypothetical protein